MKQFSFLHISDVHLGHKQFNLEERFHDFGRAFKRTVDYALEHKVDFVIIGGDFFHKRAINAETLKQAMELLQPLKDSDIPVVAIEGNHDKAFYQDKSSWLQLLNALGYLVLLKPLYAEGSITLTPWSLDNGGCVFELENFRIIGLGYLGATTEQRLVELTSVIEPSPKFTVMVLHAGVNRLMGQDLGGVRNEVLAGFRDKVNYLALGHIHSRYEDGWMFNPGSLENCHIDEAKEGREKGFYHVTVNNSEMTTLYIPANPRPVKLLSIDITGAVEPAEVYGIVRERVRELQLGSYDRPVLQVSIHGSIDFSALNIETGAMAKEIKESENCLYVEVQNNVNLPESGEDPAGGETFNRAEIERKVLEQLVVRRFPQYRDYTGQLVNLVVRIKEAALTGEQPEEIIREAAALAEKLPPAEKETGITEVAAEGGDGYVHTEGKTAEY